MSGVLLNTSPTANYAIPNRSQCSTRSIDRFIEREVLPYAPDAWYDPASVKIGYESHTLLLQAKADENPGGDTRRDYGFAEGTEGLCERS